ncbi:hypothetical protein BSL78_05836 [Apostichopus japonicus]|uniref:Uncharacterized protein n=1 Tax=Stichopus japonicus TaxID=307972 RepID=A0A2G8LAH3_STIJA|nr:hypothetical protein BSL78_05836 [Apostichopus japonicus]
MKRYICSTTKNHFSSIFYLQLLCLNVLWLLIVLTEAFSSPTCRNECSYDSQFRIADCSKTELDQIPIHDGCAEARVLDLSFNDITSLPNDSFHYYNSVLHLDISSNAIVDVQPGAFMGLDNVVSIYLSHNHITILPEMIFYSVKDTIEQIHLNRNNLFEIGEGTFSNLTKLSALFLGHNRLTDLSPNLFMDLSALLLIHLNSNQLTRIPNGLFEPLHHLKILDLSSNSIVDIYPWVFPFSSETINLANNRLQSIPRPLSSESLMELSTLDIRINEISDATNVTYFIHETDNLLLDGNPFRCDCSFNDVREWIQRDETLRTSCTWTCVNTVTMEIVLARTLKPEDTACPADTTTNASASTPGDVTEESNTSKKDTSTEKTVNSLVYRQFDCDAFMKCLFWKMKGKN